MCIVPRTGSRVVTFVEHDEREETNGLNTLLPSSLQRIEQQSRCHDEHFARVTGHMLSQCESACHLATYKRHRAVRDVSFEE